jgi:branched-chain amino acid transport system permease protein
VRTVVDRSREKAWIVPLLGAVFVVFVVPQDLGPYWTSQVILMATYALIVAGLNLTWGYAGELALGQVAMWATGAYVTAILNKHGHSDILLALILSGLAAGVVGLLSGLPAVRLSGWPLAISSFFLVLLIPNILVAFESYTNGLAGISGISGATVFGHELDHTDFYSISVAVAFVWLFILRNIVTSRLGMALQLMRKNKELASSLGVGVSRIRFFAYVLGAVPTGMAGTIFTYSLGIVSPLSFQMGALITILAASVIGGSRSVWGVPIGAFLIVWGPTQLTGTDEFYLVLYGAFLIIVGVLVPGGIAGVARRLTKRILGPAEMRTRATPQHGREVARIPGERLVVEGVTKSFGGVHALRGAGLVAEPAAITALIGPNGAGKTTLLNALSGFTKVSEGSARLGGCELLGQAASRIARLGVGRTFQTPQIPEGFTVLDVVLSGRLTVGGYQLPSAVLRLPGFRRQRRADVREAMAALHFAGLVELAHEEAQELPLGTRRLLEVVRAVAGKPGVLLLDEPAAGLDDEGLAALRSLLIRVRDAGGTVVLIEHNVPFVMDLADTVWVLDLGSPLAHGAPDEVRRDSKVIDTYLGRRSHVEKQATVIA